MILGEEKCELCKFIKADGPNWCCRRYPPTSNILLTQSSASGHTQPVELSKFRKIEPHMWCGEFKRGLLPAEMPN